MKNLQFFSIANLLAGTVEKIPLKSKKILLENLFPSKYQLSRAQINVMLSKNERFNLIKTRKICFRSKLWSNSDYRNAMELRCISSYGLKFVRDNLCSLPAYITLCKKVFPHAFDTRVYETCDVELVKNFTAQKVY